MSALFLWCYRYSPTDEWRFGDIGPDLVEMLTDAASEGYLLLRTHSRAETSLWELPAHQKLLWKFAAAPASWRCMIRQD